MNKPIRAISIFCLFLFLALMANATYLQFWAADGYNDDPRNRRIVEAAFSRERGAILVGRDPIAESVPSDDEYKFQREYPSPFVYAPITGFFSFYTQTGLEQTQNQVLSGEDPRLFVTRLVDLLSNDANQGGSVELTIDPDAQQAAYDGLRALPGDVEGSVVAIEPTTGKILAMVSLPSYDPNKLASHDLGSVGDVYDRLLEDPTDPLINRATSQRLPPGSTFKLVTAAAAIESGQYDADDDVPAGTTYDVPQTSSDIQNDGRTQCDPDEVPFATAMAWSCNTTFARMANDVGAEAMLEQAEAFGFNSDYFEDLTQAQSVYPEDPNEPETAQTGIGQFEVSATPLQMAMVAAGIANDGVVMRPYLINKVQSADYQDLEQTDPTELSQADLVGDRRGPDRPADRHRRGGHRRRRRDPRRRGGRQDRHRPERARERLPLRVVHVVRPGRQPPGRRRRRDRVGGHPARRGRWRHLRRPDRESRDGSSDGMTDHSTGSGAGERFVDDANRYRLDSRIATGGMGEVWRATDTALSREVAVKVLKAEYADDPAFRQRFAIEARHAAALQHPGVAGVYDFGEAHSAGVADGSGTPQPFLVMELVEGAPLSVLLRDGLAAERTLDRDAVRDLLAQAGDAIGAAHAAGIVHRDVKPANLMVTPSGQLKVTDFGIARAADGAGITQTGAVMGTPQYLSPEQAQGQSATSRSDVYSLGVVAFECLAGRRPFEADSPIATALAHIREPLPDLPGDVPADLAAVVRRALAKDPAERYADGTEFAAALRDPATELLRQAPVVPAAVPVPTAEATQVLPAVTSTPLPPARAASGPSRAAKRSPWLAVIVTLLAVALAAAVVLLVTTGDDTDPTPTDESTRPSRTQQPSDDESPTDPARTPTAEETSEPPRSSEETTEPPPTAETTTPPTRPPTSEPTTPPTTPPTSAPTTPSAAPPSPPASVPTSATP